MYGSNQPAHSGPDQLLHVPEEPQSQLFIVEGMLQTMSVHPGGMAVATGQYPPAPRPQVHYGLNLPPIQPSGMVTGTVPAEQGMLAHGSLLGAPISPQQVLMAQPVQLQPPMLGNLVPQGQHLLHTPPGAVQVAQQVQQAYLPVIDQQALAWVQAEDLLHMQQMHQFQQVPLWQPPPGLGPAHVHLQHHGLELQSQALQLQLLQQQVQLQQQQLQQQQQLLQMQNIAMAGQYPPIRAVAAARTSSAASAVGSSSGGGASGDVTPGRRKTRRGPNRGRSKSKHSPGQASTGGQSGPQTTSSGESGSTGSDLEEQQQQGQGPAASPEHPQADPQETRQSRRRGRKPAAGDEAPTLEQQAVAGPSSSPAPATQKQPRAPGADKPSSTSPQASATAAGQRAQGQSPSSTAGSGQQAQRTTGLSHRQRYRRKQWELQRAMEQQRLQQSGQLTGSEAVTSGVGTAVPGSAAIAQSGAGQATLADESAAARPQAATAAEDIIGQVPGSDVPETEASLPSSSTVVQQQQPMATAESSSGSDDKKLDEWLSKFLEL